MLATDPGVYGPDSLTWRLTSENAMLLGGPRALLLQLAHPLVAAGVAQHSTFRSDPIKRLLRTLEATLTIVFGTTEEAERAAAQVNAVHRAVHGELPEDAGRYPAGTPYDAADPDLLRWVQATLVDTTLTVYPLVVGPIDDPERAYQESKIAGRMLGLSDEQMPVDLDAFRAYMDQMVASDALAAAPFQRELAMEVLYPPLPWLPRWAAAPGVAITVGLLPVRVRELFGLEFTPGRRRAFNWSVRAVRGILPLLPGAIRYTPIARQARERVRR